MIEIIPALLTNDPDELRQLLEKIEKAPGKRVQIDIIDGVFADNITVEPNIMYDSQTDLLIDYHLMVDEPIDWIDRCIKGCADRIIGQIEKMSDQVEFVGKVQEVGAQVGLAIDIDTPISDLDSTILNNLDVVLVMSVKAGFGGQKFDDRALTKIDLLDEIRSRDDTPFRICDDGGITLENIDDIRRAGVNEVSIGRRLTEGDIIRNYKEFKKAAYFD
jgi:ribulose-phosphate 3-epimerase